MTRGSRVIRRRVDGGKSRNRKERVNVREWAGENRWERIDGRIAVECHLLCSETQSASIQATTRSNSLSTSIFTRHSTPEAVPPLSESMEAAGVFMRFDFTWAVNGLNIGATRGQNMPSSPDVTGNTGRGYGAGWGTG